MSEVMETTASDARIERLLARLRPNAKSLIVTLYGDAILPHGGGIWLGSLVDLVSPFGLNERVVRTSVFRLSKDGWLASTQVGRRSSYGLTDAGRRRFEAAHRTIYAADCRPWSERWTVVFTGVLDGEARDTLRTELAWQGFGQLQPGVMLHPEPDETSLRQTLAAAGLTEDAVVMRASAEGWMSAEALRGVAARAWDLEGLAEVYTTFLADFRPFLEVCVDPNPEPGFAFELRTLLVHAWRRAVLRDPLLPEELLPANWPGAAARRLCRNLYRAVEASAERHLVRIMDTADGPIGRPAASYYERFGGLG